MRPGAIIGLSAVLAGPVAAGNLPEGCAIPPFPDQAAAMACMADLDRDGDGALSREEASVLPRLSTRFDELDRDGNGRLGPGEFQGDLVSPAGKAGALGQ